MRSVVYLLPLLTSVDAFQAPRHLTRSSGCLNARRRTIVEERTYDPLQLSDEDSTQTLDLAGPLAASTVALTAALPAAAREVNDIISKGSLNPKNFDPVCPTADGFYRLLQEATMAVVGDENFVEYGPLIAGGLLRVRLELCVVESFFKEAVGPFIAQNGLSWVLPLHETVETFLAGVIFAIATTFILIGSTKILTVLFVYLDLLFGAPLRVFGGFANDRAIGKPVTLDIGVGRFKTRVIGPPKDEEEVSLTLKNKGPITLVVIAVSGTARVIGQVVGFFRDLLEGVDFFVGRYLVIWASGYILLKFAHFKVFPDFP